MHRIPTHIAGVELLRGKLRRHPDGSQATSRQLPSDSKAHPFKRVVEADAGFTSELNYLRRSHVTRTLRCVAGEIFVAVADVRLGSPTFGHWQGFYLPADGGRALFIPAGVACGWQVTSEFARLEQRCSREVLAERWRWLRWNDLELGVAWPDIPEQLADHARPSRSLATLPDGLLPKYRSPLQPRSLQKNTSTPPLRTDKNQALPLNAIEATSKATPQPVTTRIPAYRDELILVIGSSGQLGKDLCRHLSRLGKVVGACREPERGSLLPIPVQVDVSRPASIRQAIRRVKPTLIVNASGLTDLEKTEAEPRLAQLINATAPALMADEAQHIGASLVHFCSDMVFDGSGERPSRESDTAKPINQYGRTKLLGTDAVRKSGVPHLIIRTGWLYSAQGDNYVSRLVDLLTYRNSIQLAADHFGTPTSTDWLANLTCQILTKSKGHLSGWLAEYGGLFHATPLGYASRLEVGDQVVATCRALALPIVSNKLQGVPLGVLPSGIRQPSNCRLDCSKLALRFGVQLPRWQAALNEQVSDMLAVSNVVSRHVA